MFNIQIILAAHANKNEISCVPSAPHHPSIKPIKLLVLQSAAAAAACRDDDTALIRKPERITASEFAKETEVLNDTYTNL